MKDRGGERDDPSRFRKDDSFATRSQDGASDCRITNCQYKDLPARSPPCAKGLYPYMEDLMKQHTNILLLLTSRCCDKKEIKNHYARLFNRDSLLAEDIRGLEDNIGYFPPTYCRVSDHITNLSTAFHRSIGEKNKNRQIENLQTLLSLIAVTNFSYLYMSGEPNGEVFVLQKKTPSLEEKKNFYPSKDDRGLPPSKGVEDKRSLSQERENSIYRGQTRYNDQSGNGEGRSGSKESTFWEKVAQALKGEPIGNLYPQESHKEERSLERTNCADQTIDYSRGDRGPTEDREGRQQFEETQKEFDQGRDSSNAQQAAQEEKEFKKKNGPAGRAIRRECDCGTPNAPCKKPASESKKPQTPIEGPFKYRPFNPPENRSSRDSRPPEERKNRNLE